MLQICATTQNSMALDIAEPILNVKNICKQLKGADYY
jgi:hypothetical protein